MTNKVEVKKQDISKSVKEHKFNQGSVLSVLVKVAVPIVILMLFNSAYAFVDSLMSSAFVIYDDTPGAILTGGTSIGLIFPLMGMMSAFLVMVAVGSGLAYTEAVAQGNQVEAQKRKDESVTLLLFIGLMVFIAIAVMGIPYLLTASGNWGAVTGGSDPTWGLHTKEMMTDGYLYMIILGVSFIPMQMLQLYVRILRSEGKGDIAAIIPILTFPINIFLDWVLMSPKFGIEMGLVGAGLATLTANIVGLIMIMGYIWIKGSKNHIKVKIHMPKITLHKELTLIILTFAMGSLLRRLFDSGTVMILSGYIGNINTSNSATNVTDWQGSWTIITRSVNMGAMISLGVAQGVSMLVAFYAGSNQRHKLKDTLIYGVIAMLICAISASLFLFIIQGVLFTAYGFESMWQRGNEYSIGFAIAILYSIPTAIQPLAVMYYAGTKQAKKTLIHSLTFNGIVIAFTTTAFLINHITGEPLILFYSMLAGSLVGLAVVMRSFVNTYKKQTAIHI